MNSRPGTTQRCLLKLNRIDRVVAIVLPLIAWGTMIFYTRVQTDHISVYHDELWNYPAAVAVLHNKMLIPYQEIQIFRWHLPLVSGPYQGAVKTWLLVPYLAVVGTLPFALRVFNVLLAFGYLLSLYWAVRPLVSRWVALSVFLLPIADSNFLSYVPTDQGPFLLQCIFTTVALGGLVRVILRMDWKYLMIAIVMTNLTIADKLTAVPFALAFYLVGSIGLIGFWKRFWDLRRIGATILASILPLMPTVLYFYRNGFSDFLRNTNLDKAVSSAYHLQVWQNTIAFFERFLGDTYLILLLTGAPSVKWINETLFLFAGLILLIGVPCLLVVFKKPNVTDLRLMFLFPTIWGVTLMAMSLVPGLNRPWHFFILHPSFILAVILFLQRITQLLSLGLDRRAAIFGVGVFIVAILVLGVNRTTSDIVRIAENRGVNLTSPALYELRDFLLNQRAKRIVCVNYSLCYPLYVLLEGKIEFIDSAFDPLPPQRWDMFKYFLQQPNTFIVSRRFVPTAANNQKNVVENNWRGDWILKHAAEDGMSLINFSVQDSRGTTLSAFYLEHRRE